MCFSTEVEKFARKLLPSRARKALSGNNIAISQPLA